MVSCAEGGDFGSSERASFPSSVAGYVRDPTTTGAFPVCVMVFPRD